MGNHFQDYAGMLLAGLSPPRCLRAKPSLLQYDGLLCMPLSLLDPHKLRLQGGLYCKNGKYIQSSGLITNKQVVVGDGPLPIPDTALLLAGKSLYLGICHYHFGHFLVETLSRLWFLNPSDIKRFDHIVLLPLNGFIPEFVFDLFKLLGVGDRLKVITEAIILEQVWIPAPAVEYPQLAHQAIARIRCLFAQYFMEEEIGQAVFLSRNRLVPGHQRMIIGEDSLEKALQAQGVFVFHPQDHSIYEQISVLCRHKTIVGFAGSALHTLMLSGGNKKVIAYSARKVPPIFPLLDKALGNEGVYVKAGRAPLNGLAELSVGFKPQLIDPRIVLQQLKRQKVIPDDTVQGYGTAESDAQEVRRYNTALLLRWVLKASQTQTEGDCHAFIQQFVNDYALDTGMLEQARQGSALMRQFFPN